MISHTNIRMTGIIYLLMACCAKFARRIHTIPIALMSALVMSAVRRCASMKTTQKDKQISVLNIRAFDVVCCVAVVMIIVDAECVSCAGNYSYRHYKSVTNCQRTNQFSIDPFRTHKHIRDHDLYMRTVLIQQQILISARILNYRIAYSTFLCWSQFIII